MTSEPAPAPSAQANYETLEPDFCVIGAGAAGLSFATAAAAFGRRVVLIDKHKLGGESLHYGCVPSKALIAAANRAHAMRNARVFGIQNVDPRIDRAAVYDHVKGVVTELAANRSVERLGGIGVRVIQASARFLDKGTVTAGEFRIKARRFVIATGSSPVVPPIAGLQSVPYFTNETIFDNREQLLHLVVVGAGRIGLELAQAHHRLGSRVTVIEGNKALSGEDAELTPVVVDQLRREGIVILESCKIQRIEGGAGTVRLEVADAQTRHQVQGSHLLICAGRRPNTADLGLDAAGVEHDQRGITISSGLRTTNRCVYAIGDANGGPPFSHVGVKQAEIVLRRTLFRIPSRFDTAQVPWVVFTDPQLAHAGLSEADARKLHRKVHVQRWPFSEVDRARAEHQTAGYIKVVTTARGRVLGAEIVGAHAGELINVWALAISQGLRIGALASYMSPYPTLSEISRQVAWRSYAGVPGNPFIRKVIDVLAKLG